MEPNANSADVGSKLDVPTDPKQMRSDLRHGANEAVRAVRRVHGDGPLPTIPVEQTNDPTNLGSFNWDGATGAAKNIEMSDVDPDGPALTAVHEIGHFLDHSGLSGEPANLNDFESKKESTRTMQAVMKAIRQSPRYALLQGNSYLTFLRGRVVGAGVCAVYCVAERVIGPQGAARQDSHPRTANYTGQAVAV